MPSDEAPQPVRAAFLPIDFGPDFAENVKLLQRRMREYNRGADAIEPLELFARNGKLCLAPGTYPEYFFQLMRYFHALGVRSGPRSSLGDLQFNVMYRLPPGGLEHMREFFAERWEDPWHGPWQVQHRDAYIIAWLEHPNRSSDAQPLAFGLR
ncbi:hypothetical protein KBD34_00335 [Patescibacteria group bacterium]|nr:hypothetical protein [Patescibacteria group bacterium]